MKPLAAISLVLSACVCGASFAAGAERVPAFPGAAGGGALAQGGRGGRVIEVTTLAGKGPGSFTEAVLASGPRTVVFRVAGTINLGDWWVTITEPYLTIAGQTAPGAPEGGGGVCIKGQLKIKTHNVIVQYLRVRPGGNLGPQRNQPSSCIMLQQPAHTIMIDHCSLQWATDENVTIYSVDGPMHSVTVSNCIIAEGLRLAEGAEHNQHSCGLIVGSQSNPELVTDISLHHNFFAHTQNRNPYFKGRSGDIVSNIVYDWQWWGCMVQGGAEVDVVSNLFRAGPSFEAANWTTKRGVRWTPWSPTTQELGAGDHGVQGSPSLYLAGNIDDEQREPLAAADEGNWSMLDARNATMRTSEPYLREWRRSAPRASSAIAVTATPAQQLEAWLLPHVGASRRLAEDGTWVSSRDAVDARIIEQYHTRSGSIPVSIEAVGGFPIVPAGEAFADSDHDGMPDAYERAKGLDPGDPRDGSLPSPAAQARGEAYTNLEVFLQGAQRGLGAQQGQDASKAP